MARAIDTPIAPPDTKAGTRPKTRDVAAEQRAEDIRLANEREARAVADANAREARANARADERERRTGRRMLRQADNMNAQADALRRALNASFGANLRQGLADVQKNLEEQRGILLGGAQQRAAQLRGQGLDTEQAAGDAASVGFSNMVRERYDALTGLINQGAGETDTMRAMLMSARNWHANASENNRSYFDTMRSINTGITDLNVDTRTGLANMYGAAEAEKDRLYADYYNKRAETLTQIGNIRGQQTDYYEQAAELGVNPKNKSALGNIKAQSKDAYMDAADEQGKSYKQAPLPEWVKKYEVQGQLTARQSNTNLASAVRIEKADKAQGSDLRRWNG